MMKNPIISNFNGLILVANN